MDDLRFFSPYADTVFLKNRLPHWEQINATYFVTFRLADSVPRELRERWIWDRDFWLKKNPPPHSAPQEAEYHQLFSARMEDWLDAGMGSCVLRESTCAKIVADALQHFEGTRSHQLAFVVMPNHVHTLFATMGNESIADLIQSWKSYTSRRIGEILHDKWPGWQKDYYDRLVRDETHFGKCARYIRKNPTKARLSENEFVLFESDRAKQC